VPDAPAVGNWEPMTAVVPPVRLLICFASSVIPAGSETVVCPETRSPANANSTPPVATVTPGSTDVVMFVDRLSSVPTVSVPGALTAMDAIDDLP
jgi:hypothetical protein